MNIVNRLRAICFSFCVLCAVIYSANTLASTGPSENQFPPNVSRALKCLVSDRFVNKHILSYIGLKIGDRVEFRYYFGSVNYSPNSPGTYNFVLYSQDNSRSAVLFVTPMGHRKFEVENIGYLLKRHDNTWVVSEGEGGYQDYLVFGQFVTRLSNKPSYHAQLRPAGKGCMEE